MMVTHDFCLLPWSCARIRLSVLAPFALIAMISLINGKLLVRSFFATHQCFDYLEGFNFVFA